MQAEKIDPSNISRVVYFNSSSSTSEAETLRKVDEMIKEINDLPHSQGIQQGFVNKLEIQNRLEDCYQLLTKEISNCKNPLHPSKEVALRLADVLRMYGRICYNNEKFYKPFEFAKQMLLPALQLYLYATNASDLGLDFTDQNMATIPNLIAHIKSTIDESPPFSYIGRGYAIILPSIVCFPPGVVSEHVANAKLTAYQQFSYAYTLRWLNGAYRESHDRSQCSVEEMVENRQQRHAILISRAEEILRLEPESAQKDAEIFELFYNDMPGFCKLMAQTGSNDREEWMIRSENNWEWLIKYAEAKGDTLGLRRIYHKRAVMEEDKVKSKEYMDKAVYYNSLLSESDQVPGLHALFLSSQTYMLLELKVWTAEEAERAGALICKAKLLVDELRRYDHHSSDFCVIDNHYDEVIERLSLGAPYPKIEKVDPMVLMQKAFGYMKLAEPQMIAGNWQQAYNPYKIALDILKEIQTDQEELKLLIKNMTGQAEGTVSNLEKRISESGEKGTDKEKDPDKKV